jgi:hypothetical protein
MMERLHRQKFNDVDSLRVLFAFLSFSLFSIDNDDDENSLNHMKKY